MSANQKSEESNLEMKTSEPQRLELCSTSKCYTIFCSHEKLMVGEVNDENLA